MTRQQQQGYRSGVEQDATTSPEHTMNAADRKQLAALTERLTKMEDEANDIAMSIQEMADAEQEKFDNMSEGLQQGENGQRIESAASALSDAASTVESLASEISTAIDSLNGIE